MERRALLKNTALAGVAVISPFRKNFIAQNNKPIVQNINGYRRFTFGDLEITIVTDGHIIQQPVQPFLAPRGNAQEVRKLLEANFRPTDFADMPMNVMIVHSKDKLVLLDCGIGVFGDANGAWLPKSLADAGFKPEDFTDIIISHAHPDHIGGLVNKQQQLIYPNANIHIGKTEYDFWVQATLNDFTKSGLWNEKAFLQQLLGGIKQVLQTIKPKINFLDYDKGLYNIFSFELAPGHTPGLTLTTITSGNEKMIYIADLIHSDVLLFPHPEWGFSGDTDIDLAVTTRKKVLQQLASEKIKIFAYHLPWPGLGYTAVHDNAFAWVPEVFSTP
ncbi:MBL fold metallo-hydrolase [Parafilimonas sp.]|uniref:MBL fold metallo-hydrolase n=1 Tax=Parafilimonas sp. TaxID=1969739 RepID=UPI0039E4094E